MEEKQLTVAARGKERDEVSCRGKMWQMGRGSKK